jgi:hypothetical protein
MTGAFLDPIVRQQLKGRWHRLVQDLRYQAADGTVYRMPAGFEYNGASVPRLLWWLYPPLGDDYDRAVCLHDFLYRYAERFPGMTRGTADALFLEAMEADSFRPSGRRTVHAGTRVGGWWAWRKHRKAARQAETATPDAGLPS